MVPPPERRISDEIWLQHQHLIRHLYVVQRLPLDIIRRHLQDQYSFHASVHQYKRRFRKWGYLKNLKASTCRGIAYAHERRQLSSANTCTQVQGVAVSPRRLQRAIARHNIPSLRQKMALEHRPPTPDNVVIQRVLIRPSAFSIDRLPGARFLGQARNLWVPTGRSNSVSCSAICCLHFPVRTRVQYRIVFNDAASSVLRELQRLTKAGWAGEMDLPTLAKYFLCRLPTRSINISMWPTTERTQWIQW